MSEDFIDRCERYLKSIDKEVNEAEIEELENRVADLEEEREEYLEEYGEDDVLVERVDDELEKLRNELDSKRRELNQTDELAEKVLEHTASEFIAEGQFLDESSLAAINHSLTGNRESMLLIGDQKITSDTEIEGNVRRVSHIVRKLALAKLGKDDDIKDSWKSVEGGKRHEPFLVVATAEAPLSTSEITERIDEDASKGTVGGRLRDSVNKIEYPPYNRVDGNYRLSTIGEVMFQEFEDEIEQETSAEEPETIEGGREESKSEQQITLNSTAEKDD